MEYMNFCRCDCRSAHYLNVKIKKGEFFFTQEWQVPLRGSSALLSWTRTGGSAEPSPHSHPPSRSPSSGAVLGLQGAISARRGINRRCAVALWIAGGTVHLSSHAPGWISTAYEWERSGMSAMMATNSLTSEHGCIRLSLLTAGGRLPSRSGAAAPEHWLSLGMVPPRPGAPAPSPACREGAADGEGGG